MPRPTHWLILHHVNESDLFQDFQVDGTPAEAATPEHDPESSITPEDDAGSQNTHVPPLPASSVPASQAVRVPEDPSSTVTVSPEPSACRSET